MFHKVKFALKQQITHQVAEHFGNKRTLLFQPPEINNPNCEDVFTTADGRAIPVLRNHRYAMKDCWAYFGPLAALKELNEQNLIDEKSKNFLNHAKGYRTLSEPLTAVREVLAPWLKKHKDLFITTHIPDMGRFFLKPSPQKVKAKIDAKAAEHKILLDKINTLVSHPPRAGEKVMEVGYTSGGESIIAFEKLGFKPVGIDNLYENSMESGGRYAHIANITGTKTNFLMGDITTRTEIPDNDLAFIYTQSVLEHINDLPAAFKEMYRILRPGGSMFHYYDPYFHIRGGHTPCTLDSPWAHVRMDDTDIETYIKEYRPNEADVVMPWIRSALNRNHNQTWVQKALIEAGFKLRLWENLPVSPARLPLLTSDIVSECLLTNKDISLDDLASEGIMLVVEKPLNA